MLDPSNLAGVALLLGLLLVGLRLMSGADSELNVSVKAPGLGFTVVPQRLYARDDPWADYLAPESACPGGENESAPLLSSIGQCFASSTGRGSVTACPRCLRIQPYRENLLRDGWSEQGIALLPVELFNGQRQVALWVSNFGRTA